MIVANRPDASAAQSSARVRSTAHQLASSTVTILSLVLLGFVVYVGPLSSLRHDRAQHAAYANLRKDLAQATAPVAQTQVQANPNDPLKLLKLGTSVAVLTIPKLGLKEVVFEGTTPSVLQNGPGHLRSTPLPGQLGVSEIFGRATTYGGPFSKLSQLAPGDLISVLTGQGGALFTVVDVRRAGDPRPDPLAAGKGRLLLVTADGAPLVPSGVLRVDADLVGTARPTPDALLTGANLAPSERVMGTDSSAWYALVLWGQALVLLTGVFAWLRVRWGRWQTWIIAVPVLLFFGVGAADQAACLLPNLI